MKKSPPKPTASELEILHVLWSRGPSTVREVLDALSEKKSMGYTGVLKLLQIMTDKGLVVRDESQRAHVYTTRESEQRTQRRLIGDLIDRAFGGSPAKLVLQALSGTKATAEELNAIRQLVESMEGDAK